MLVISSEILACQICRLKEKTPVTIDRSKRCVRVILRYLDVSCRKTKTTARGNR